MAKDPGKPPVNPAGRAELLKEKERELAEVVDEHDDLVSLHGPIMINQSDKIMQVREQYHMERFVTMITGFDPAVRPSKDLLAYSHQELTFLMYRSSSMRRDKTTKE
jgi:hypothetical protein